MTGNSYCLLSVLLGLLGFAVLEVCNGRQACVSAVTPCWYAGRSPAPLADLQRHQVEDLIGCGVRNMELYRAALSSKSAVEPDQIIARSFDRLEFLGDAVVGQVFKDYIFQR